MVRHKYVFIFALFAHLFGVKSVLAQVNTRAINPSTNWEEISNFCSSTQKISASPNSLERASIADKEWRYFGRQFVDQSGRIVKFGGSEAETNENISGSSKINNQVPWLNVLRYWSLAHGEPSHNLDSLHTFIYQSGGSTDENARISASKQVEVVDVLKVLEQNPQIANEVRQGILDATLRAAIVDVPWSAAFISAVHAQSRTPTKTINATLGDASKNSVFRASEGHIDYIRDAYNTTRNEINGNSLEANGRFTLYRACNPYTTKPRIGDMICSSRLSDLTAHNTIEIFDIYGNNITGANSISTSHCDIVVNVDVHSKKVDLIGGNVFQSVTKRRLNLNQQLFLSPSQRLIGNSEISDCSSSANCELNDKSWFILMQVR